MKIFNLIKTFWFKLTYGFKYTPIISIKTKQANLFFKENKWYKVIYYMKKIDQEILIDEINIKELKKSHHNKIINKKEK